VLLPSCPVWSSCGPVDIVPVLPLFRVQSNWSPRGRLIHSQKPPSKSQVPEIPLKLWSNYSSILFSYSPHPFLLPSIRPFVWFVRFLVRTIISWMHAFTRQLTVVHFSSQPVSKAIYHSIVNLVLFKCPSVYKNRLFIYIRLFKYAHVSMVLNFAC